MRGALEGVTILDLTQQLAGPGGTMLLGDMGADVIRVEPPPARAISGADLPSRVALNVGRSKRSIALDLSKPEAREIAYAIARRADVVCQNYRHGVAEKLGMDLDSLRKVNPQIIYSRVSAYGDRGPEAFRAGFDIVSQSGAGSMVAGPDGKMPVAEKVPLGDVTGFCLETIGILAALYHRNVTGVAQALSTSMLAGSLLQNILRLVSIDDTDREWRRDAIERARSLIAEGAPYRDVLRATATSSGGEIQSAKDREPLGTVYYRTYRTKDGYVAVGCRNARQQQRLNRLLDLGDPRFEPDASRKSLSTAAATGRIAQMPQKASALFAARTTAEMLAMLEEAEIACGPICNLLETFDSPQLLANEYIVEHAHPKLGGSKVIGYPISFEKTPMRITRPAPAVGADCDEVLSWLGFSAEETRSLRERQIVC
ncbi:MAG: CaiB/BaiF CoA transferase family protein [Candidatus Binataceae bacterium]